MSILENNSLKCAEEEIKQEKSFTVKDGVFALIFVAISFVIFKLFFTGDMRTGTVVSSGYYHIIVAVMGVLSLFYIAKKPTVTQWVIFGVSMFFCAVPFFSSTPTVRFLSWVYAAISLCYFAFSFSYEGSPFGNKFAGRLVKSVIAVPFENFSASFKSIITIIGKAKSKISVLLYIVCGLVVSLPATFLCVHMLSGADENFDKIAEGIARFLTNDIGTNIITLVFSLPLSFLLFGYLANTKAVKKIEENTESGIAVIPAPMICSAVTPILISYILFFFCQLPYFLGAFGGTLPEGFSYSEYARNGFFELCTVCFINFIILLIANGFSKNREDGGKPITVRVFLSLLCVTTIILITSALSKMVLYINEMGLTEKRFYTSWFMVALGVVFIIELIREIKPDIPAVKLQLAGFSVMLALLCFSDPDARIAQNNVEGYVSGKYQTIDLYSMYDLSESALPYISGLYSNDNGTDFFVSDYKDSLIRKRETTMYFPVGIPSLNAEKYL